MPDDVKASIETNKWAADKTPGVIVMGDDGTLTKVSAESHDDNVDLEAAPEPTRFDKSVSSVLNGRNAAMYVAIECKKRQWELEFECLEADGPVHNRVYSYSLTVGPPGSDDVLVTAGIAKGKRECKRRCCDAMVLKMSDLPPAPPLHVQMQMRGMQVRPGFRPQLPPPESEDTVFKKYDKTAYGDDHPNKNHPVFQLCSKAKRLHWPPPQFELVTEKIVDTIRNKHGKSNTMLYTYKVTVWPGVGQVEPKVFFGSGPTKKDAKFACGTIAWAAIQNPSAVKEQLGVDGSLPQAGGEDAAQLAVKMAAEVTGPKIKSAQHITEDKWLQQVAKHAERSVDLKAEVEQLKAEKAKKLEEEEKKREEERERRKKEREERWAKEKDRSRSRDRKRKTDRHSRDHSRERSSRHRRSRSREMKKERRSRSRSVKKEKRSRSRSVKKERRSRSRSVKKERRSRSRSVKKEVRSPSRSVKREKRSRSRDRRRSRS